MNIFYDLEGEEVMLKYRKIKAYAFVEALIALMIATLTVVLLSFVLGDSFKRETHYKCQLNEYSKQLMSLHERRLPVPYSEIKKGTTNSNRIKEKETNHSSIKNEKIKEVVRYKKADSKAAPTSVITHCNQEEVIQVEEIGPAEKISISSN